MKLTKTKNNHYLLVKCKREIENSRILAQEYKIILAF